MSRIVRNQQSSITPDSWVNDKNGSLFIKYIPNNVTKTNLRDMFNFLGNISRIDVVNISENGSGRRAFIHFSEWKNTNESFLLRSNIADCYPTHFQYWNEEFSFEFSITLNCRPIPTTELNLYQIQDWSQRLNDEFCDFKKESQNKIDHLTHENEYLNEVIHQMRNDMQNIKQSMTFLTVPQFQPIQYVDEVQYIDEVQYADEDQYIDEVQYLDEVQYSEETDIQYADEHCIWIQEESVLDEFEDEMERIHENPLFDEQNQDLIEEAIDSERNDDEMEFFDLDSVEAGMKRERDPMIYNRQMGCVY